MIAASMNPRQTVFHTIHQSLKISPVVQYSPFQKHARIVAVTAHETENKSSSTLNAAAPNGSHHSATEVSDESNYRDSFLPENMSDASNDGQKHNTSLIDADYLDDPLSTNEIPNKFDHNISEESNFNYLISSVAQPHHLVTFSRLSVQ
ncbi:unnamed protein product [Schistosoma mattheei]|uniref:Uncharacterized protein n=1 Tax=Schistosoma mattheei TaxID=31246 RepID=A0A183NQA5_9TREM|nr:unnamed protein product [Schistosoma mattheei]